MDFLEELKEEYFEELSVDAAASTESLYDIYSEPTALNKLASTDSYDQAYSQSGNLNFNPGIYNQASMLAQKEAATQKWDDNNNTRMSTKLDQKL